MPQGSVLGPGLYLLYNSDIPILGQDTIPTFADDSAIMVVRKDREEAANNNEQNLQLD